MKFDNFVFGVVMDASSNEVAVSHTEPYRPFPDPDGQVARAVISNSRENPQLFEIITYTSAVTTGNTTVLGGVTRGADGTVEGDWSSGKAVIRQDLTAADLELLALQEPTQFLYVAGQDTAIRKWSPNGHEEWLNSVLSGAAKSVDVDATESFVVAGANNRIACIDARTGATVWSDDLFAESLMHVAADGGGAYVQIHSGIGGAFVHRYDDEGSPLTNSSSINDAARGLSLAPNGVVTSIHENSIRQLNGETLDEIVVRDTTGVDGVATSLLGEILIWEGNLLTTLCPWLSTRWTATAPANIRNAVWGKDGHVYATSTDNNVARVSPPSGEIGPGGQWNVLFSTNAPLVDVAANGDIYLLEPLGGRQIYRYRPDGTPLRTMVAPLSEILDIALSPIHVAQSVLLMGGQPRAEFLRELDVVTTIEDETLTIREKDAEVVIQDPPAGHVLLYVSADKLRARFSDGSDVEVA